MERDLDKKMMSEQKLPEVQLTLNEWLFFFLTQDKT